MAGFSGKGGTLTIIGPGGSTVISNELGRWSIGLTNTLVDTTGLGHRIERTAVGSAAVNLEAERIVDVQSGMRWDATLGAYDGADLESVNVNLSIGEIETGDVADHIDQRVPDALNGTVEFGTRYAGNQHFCDLVEAAASGAAAINFAVVDRDGSTVIGGTAVMEAGTHENPRGANRQTGRAKFLTVTSVKASYTLLASAKVTWSSVASQAYVLKDKAGTTVFEGQGFTVGGTLTTGRNTNVRETLRATIHAIDTLI